MTSSSLGQYTPSMMSNYNDIMQNHLTAFSYGNRNNSPTRKSVSEEEPIYNGPVNDDRANDFYSFYNADTAALLW